MATATLSTSIPIALGETYGSAQVEPTIWRLGTFSCRRLQSSCPRLQSNPYGYRNAFHLDSDRIRRNLRICTGGTDNLAPWHFFLQAAAIFLPSTTIESVWLPQRFPPRFSHARRRASLRMNPLSTSRRRKIGAR